MGLHLRGNGLSDKRLSPIGNGLRDKRAQSNMKWAFRYVDAVQQEMGFKRRRPSPIGKHWKYLKTNKSANCQRKKTCRALIRPRSYIYETDSFLLTQRISSVRSQFRHYFRPHPPKIIRSASAAAAAPLIFCSMLRIR
ncbi:hypothetical protein SDJN03_20565, partial [Cucurbita argyrosperma subsp. sororia]